MLLLALLQLVQLTSKSQFLKYLVLNWISAKSIHMRGPNGNFLWNLPIDWTTRQNFILRLTVVAANRVEQLYLDVFDIANDANVNDNQMSIVLRVSICLI